MNKTFETLLKQAAAKLQAFDLGDAAKLYKKALKQRPGNAAAQMGLAMVLNRTGESAKALPMLQKVWNVAQANKSKIDKDTQAEVLNQLALALRQQGKIEQALTCYNDAYKLRPSEELKGLIASLSNSMTGITPFEQLLQHAKKCEITGQLDEAIKTYKAALQLNADDDRALHGLGNTLREQGDLQGALPLIQQAIIMQPEVAEYHNSLGMLFQQRGEVEKAATFHLRAIKLNPANAPALCNLGVAFKRLNRLEEAVAAYRQALQIDPNLPEAHNNLGNLLWMMEDFAGAKASLEQALKLRPGYADAQQNLNDLIASGKIMDKKSAQHKTVTDKTVEPTSTGKAVPKAVTKAAANKAGSRTKQVTGDRVK